MSRDAGIKGASAGKVDSDQGRAHPESGDAPAIAMRALGHSGRGKTRRRADCQSQMSGIRGPRQAQVSERPEPKAPGDVVKIQVLVAPLCTEWQSWRAGQSGHDLSHKALDAAQSPRVKVGDRVIARPHRGCGT